MGQQMPNGNLRLTVTFEFRDVVRNRVVQAYSTLLDQQHGTGSCRHNFGERSEVE